MSSLNLPPLPPKKQEEEKEFVPDYLYNALEVEQLFTTNDKKVFGVPGASLSWGINGVRHSDVMLAGKEGENATAKILNELAEKTPNFYVFHSLRWPESNGDTDHIVVYKDLAIVIDSKRWKGSRKYSITPKGAILRGTVPFPEGRVKIGGALQVWRKKLAGTTVKGIVAIAQEKVFVVRDRNWYKAPFRLVEEEKLVTELLETIQKHQVKSGYKGNIHLLKSLAGFLVKPRDPRAGLIQGSTENPFR